MSQVRFRSMASWPFSRLMSLRSLLPSSEYPTGQQALMVTNDSAEGDTSITRLRRPISRTVRSYRFVDKIFLDRSPGIVCRQADSDSRADFLSYGFRLS